MNLRLNLTFGLTLLALAGCVPADTAQQATQPPEAVPAPAQAYQGAVLPYGLNDAAVEIGANDRVPRMDSGLYQRLGPICPVHENYDRGVIINGERIRFNNFTIAWQNEGIRPWDHPDWPSNMTEQDLLRVACARARVSARMMQDIPRGVGLGGNLEQLSEFEGMTKAELRANATGTYNYRDRRMGTPEEHYNYLIRAWEMANFTYAVARAQGIPVNR